MVDKMRLRSDQRVGEMNKLAQEFSQGITVFVHLVHGKPESQLLKVAQKHVRRTAFTFWPRPWRDPCIECVTDDSSCPRRMPIS